MSAVVQHETREVQAAPERIENPVMDMIRQAVAAGQPIEVIRELKEMAKELAADEARRKFDEAVSAAKAEITPIARSEKGHNGKYADLAAIAAAVDPILSRHGLHYRHRTEQSQAGLTVTCIISHERGHREETSITAGADNSGSKNSIQAIGSTQTYLMRYTLVSALGLATAKDDDAVAAGRGETINDDQLKNLRALADEVNADLEKFCEYFKIGALPELPAKEFFRAMDSLRAKKGRQQ